jgi:hypothetical protein
MNQHPYLRAYMAGITIPTVLLLVAMTAFTFARYIYHVPVPIERVIVFPMAVVPNLWGVWNVLWFVLRRRVSIGLFGAILPVILGPLAYGVTRIVRFDIPPSVFPIAAPIFLLVGMTIYYLAWKYLVAALNRIVGLA